MNELDLTTVKDLVLRLQEATGEERSRILETELANRPDLRSEVLELLDASDHPPMRFLGHGREGTERSYPQRISRYTIEGVLGRGGMSCVYRARQTSPIERAVALKVMRPGTDPHLVLARFELERQAMARLSHQNIARVFDAGSDEHGNPFFVMELVDGPNLLEYCLERRIAMRQRLDLFVRVCRAVQHAHDRGLIHRDLKPSNVLVAFEDGQPIPKVIDFGVSRWIGDVMHRQTLAGQLVGTPHYMSPEQARLDANDIDVRTDVFSLGVMLYELLTGRLPHPDEIYRFERLPDLAGNLTKLTPTSPSVMAARRDTPLSQSLGPIGAELDCIVLKAVAGDRGMRYPGVGQLADDIERFLHGEAVQARAPSSLYLARKFVQRNRVMAGITLGTLMALLGIIGATLVGLVRTQEQRDRAEAAVSALTFERDRTKAALATTEEVAGYLRDLLMRAHPAQLGPAANFKQILEAAAADLVESPPQSSQVRARVAFALAEPLYMTGNYQLSGQLLTPVVDSLESEETAESRELLGMILMRLGYVASRSGDRAGSEAWFSRAGALGKAHGMPDLEFKSQGAVAQSLAARGEYARGIELMKGMLDHPVAKADELLRASLLSNLGVALGRAGQTAEGEIHQREGYEIRLRRSPQEPTTYQMGWQLGTSMMEVGRLDEAVEFLDRNTIAAAAALGEDHPDVLAGVVMTQYARARRGDGPSVLDRLREAVAKQSASGMPAAQVAFQEAYVVGAAAFAGPSEEAIAHADALVARRVAAEGDASLNIIQLRLQIGSMFSVAGLHDAAHELLIAAYEPASVASSPARGMASRIAGAIRWNYFRAGDTEKASEWQRRAVELAARPTAATP